MRPSVILKVSALFLASGLFFMTPASAQEACDACDTVYTLEQTIAASELIILAESEPFKGTKPNGPATIEAKVLSVLKGKYSGDTITLKSWLGMCPYGFVFVKPQEVLFIVKDITGAYTSYENACGTASLPYVDGKVDGKYTLEEFKAKYLK